MKNYRKLISTLGVIILFISLTFVGCTSADGTSDISGQETEGDSTSSTNSEETAAIMSITSNTFRMVSAIRATSNTSIIVEQQFRGNCCVGEKYALQVRPVKSRAEHVREPPALSGDIL